MNRNNSEKRLAENQVMFRKYNERLQHGIDDYNEMAAEVGEPPFPLPNDTILYFNCECSDNNCNLRVKITLGAYNMIHATRDTFCVIKGHEILKAENVILSTEDYNVVQKKRYPNQDAQTLHPNDIHNV